MCREIVNGGRRCPCSRGDRRRAYQRIRYATRQTAVGVPVADGTSPAAAATTPADSKPKGATLADLEQRRETAAAAVDEARTVLRDPDRSNDPDVQEAYLNAVLTHGSVVRDIAHRNIDQAYADRGLDDAAVSAEAAAVAQRLDQVESEWCQAKTRADSYLTADGAAFVSDEGADAIDTARTIHIAAKQDIYRHAVERSNEINSLRAQIAKEAYYRELARERSFGGATFTPANTVKMTKADRAMFTSTAALFPDEMVEHADSLGSMLAKRSKARAHYTSAARQRSRDWLVDALEHFGEYRGHGADDLARPCIAAAEDQCIGLDFDASSVAQRRENLEHRHVESD